MFKQIEPKQIPGNVFSTIGDQWMLVTAGRAGDLNTMTVSWGALGVLWGKPSATIYLRPQRYTKEFLDREEEFTLSVFGEAQRPALALCGSKSGRDVDKIAQSGLTPAFTQEGTPYFEEAQLVLVCRKRYRQTMDHESMPLEVKEQYFAQRDYHTMYIGEIVQVLQRD